MFKKIKCMLYLHNWTKWEPITFRYHKKGVVVGFGAGQTRKCKNCGLDQNRET